MRNQSTIPSQLGPAHTIPALLGESDRMDQRRAQAPSNLLARYALLVAALVAVVYLFRHLPGG